MKLLGDRNGVFPRRLATQDFFIQDPRYLQCYANMFCRFIDAQQKTIQGTVKDSNGEPMIGVTITDQNADI